MLYDPGPGQGGDRSAAARFLVPYLRSRGIERIDALVVSHLDAGHAGGAAAVVEQLKPKLLVTSFDPRLLALPEDARRAVSHERCEAGRTLRLEGMQLDMLHPPAIARLRRDARDDAVSCVLRIATPAGSVLLGGDLPASADASLVAAAGDRLRASVLVVPQQGGRHAASKALLEAVAASHALLQVGYRNRHRHPHPEVLERLAQTRVQVLRTDQDGAVQVRLRAGRAPAILRERRDSPPYWRVPVPGNGEGEAAFGWSSDGVRMVNGWHTDGACYHCVMSTRKSPDSPARRRSSAVATAEPGVAAKPVARADIIEELVEDAGTRGRGVESEKITINLGAVDLGSIDLLVAEGFFSNRSDLIRTAVRNLLAAHRDIINGAVLRQDRTLGLRRITRAELEGLQRAGERIRIGVVGLVVIDGDVPAELAQQTIAELSVLGSLQASPAVRRALAGRIA